MNLMRGDVAFYILSIRNEIHVSPVHIETANENRKIH